MIALAFDPGVTTGFAYCTIEGHVTLKDIEARQDRMNENELFEMLTSWRPEHVIYESFEFRNAIRGGTELYSRNLIGIINLYGQRYGEGGLLYEQTPSSAMGYWTNDRLKAAGLYQPGKEHANDAMRHLLTWLTFKRGSTLWQETGNHFLRQHAHVP